MVTYVVKRNYLQTTGSYYRTVKFTFIIVRKKNEKDRERENELRSIGRIVASAFRWLKGVGKKVSKDKG